MSGLHYYIPISWYHCGVTDSRTNRIKDVQCLYFFVYFTTLRIACKNLRKDKMLRNIALVYLFEKKIQSTISTAYFNVWSLITIYLHFICVDRR